MPPEPTFLTLVSAASQALKSRMDEVNRLNVFPVPDGDTGTNMSLTMDAVVAELTTLPSDATLADVCKTVTHASLMGARGNSGVILSQVIRGMCDVIAEAEEFSKEMVSDAISRSETVAYQAVRKPVEGTMLTVIKDAAAEARILASKDAIDLDEMLELLVRETYASVRRTPDLLPVLRENAVVDAGAYGVALLAEGLLAAYGGHDIDVGDIPTHAAPALSLDQEDDWDDDEYLYCTEFLLHGDGLNDSDIGDYVSSVGGSELVVGDGQTLKIHVHTDDPGSVIAKMTSLGEVSEVHINNMRIQTSERTASLAEEAEAKPYGIVTVAAGDGIKEILSSLGADLVVSGGQTMNPSTAEILEACETLKADKLLILPNNKNIHMSAQQAAEVSEREIGVIPTRTIPEAFSALLAFDPDAELEANIEAMTEAASYVRTGEVTTAVKDSKGKVGEIREGQIIGIADHEIEVVGDDLLDVTTKLTELLLVDAEILTVLAGEDMSDEVLSTLMDRLTSAHPDVEVEAHRGEQPLYPVILAAE